VPPCPLRRRPARRRSAPRRVTQRRSAQRGGARAGHRAARTVPAGGPWSCTLACPSGVCCQQAVPPFPFGAHTACVAFFFFGNQLGALGGGAHRRTGARRRGGARATATRGTLGWIKRVAVTGRGPAGPPRGVSGQRPPSRPGGAGRRWRLATACLATPTSFPDRPSPPAPTAALPLPATRVCGRRAWVSPLARRSHRALRQPAPTASTPSREHPPPLQKSLTRPLRALTPPRVGASARRTSRASGDAAPPRGRAHAEQSVGGTRG